MRTVLVIDDNEDSRELLRMGFEAKGWRVVTASDGCEGLKLAKKERPDAVMTDLSMPCMDGQDLAKALRKFLKVPIVAITGWSHEMDRRPFDMVMTKPVLPQDAVDAIEALLKSR